MATQKQLLAVIQNDAADLGFKVTIRKRTHDGGYLARLIPNANRFGAESYLCDTFDAAVALLAGELSETARAQRIEGQRRQREYAQALDVAIDQARAILALVGCTIVILRANPYDATVVLRSPKTGSHSLQMTLGVRPVSDLLAHVVGFAETQTYIK